MLGFSLNIGLLSTDFKLHAQTLNSQEFIILIPVLSNG